MYDTAMGSYRQLVETSKRITEFVLEVSDVLARAQERIVHQRSAVIEVWLETAINEWQALADAESSSDLLSLQVDVVANLSEQMLATLQELVDIQLQAKEEILECVQESLTTMHPSLLLPALTQQTAAWIPNRLTLAASSVPARHRP